MTGYLLLDYIFSQGFLPKVKKVVRTKLVLPLPFSHPILLFSFYTLFNRKHPNTNPIVFYQDNRFKISFLVSI